MPRTCPRSWSTTYRFGADPTLDEGVPRQLAERLCPGECMVTKNISLLEPGITERKYYAWGIGVIAGMSSKTMAATSTTGVPYWRHDGGA